MEVEVVLERGVAEVSALGVLEESKRGTSVTSNSVIADEAAGVEMHRWISER